MEKEKLFTHLFPLCSIVFLGCLPVGISLRVLPSYVHQHLHFDNLLVGIVIGIESAATLATRHFSGSLADARSSSITVIWGIGLSAFSGTFYLLSYLLSGQAVRSLVALIAGRILPGCGESLLITGALSWGVGLLGHQRSGKTMAWVGIAIYGAIACGAPLGLSFFDQALGVTAPAAGLIAGHFGYAQIYCFGALATDISALLALSTKNVRQTVS